MSSNGKTLKFRAAKLKGFTVFCSKSACIEAKCMFNCSATNVTVKKSNGPFTFEFWNPLNMLNSKFRSVFHQEKPDLGSLKM